MPTATLRHMNWSGVTFTPAEATQTPIVIKGVTSVQIDTGGSLAKFAGDGDRYNTIVVNDFNEPTVSIQTADLHALTLCSVGMTGTLRATHNDARNGSGVGSITYTLTNAVVASNPSKGGHRQFGQGTITFTAFAPDGQTNPLTTTPGS